MRTNFLDYLKHNRVYLDGALGSELIARGYRGEHPELLNIFHPEALAEIYDGYIAAGSDMISTNTFGANSLKLGGTGFTLKEVICAGIQVARESAKEKYVAYSCGPLGSFLKPFGNLAFEDAYELFKEQAVIAERCGADYAVIETMSDLLELKAAVLAFKENTSLPVACSMSFDERGRTFTGASIGAFALTAQGLGVDLLGLNCGLGPDLMALNAKELIKYAHIPVFIKPNAGLPEYKNGETFYTVDAEKFSDCMKEIAELGVSALGGCCGTGREHIAATVRKTRDIPFKFFSNRIDAVCSASTVVEFKPTLKIGERVNPTGKPALKKALSERDFDYVVSMCAEQAHEGAELLDLNAGMPGIDEAAVLAEIVQNVQAAVTLPLQLDSAKPEAIESALRVVNGVPIVNSVNGDKKSTDAIFPLAKKYGAYVVALCLDGNGVPETVEGRLSVARKLIEAAECYGIERDKLLFDALTMAVSVDGRNSSVTLETAKRLRDELKVKTVLVLSNVSFGLPARELINAEFYAQAEVTAVIIDPKLAPKRDVYAQAALSGKDVNCSEYIKKYSGAQIETAPSGNLTLYEAIVNGVKCKVDADENNYLEVMEKDIVGALNALGERYEKGQVFLPQLIASAESAKAALDEIKSRFMKENENVKATVVLATVKGDVHDIGKNIVKALLGSYGYKIVDLGKDVDAQTVVKALEEHNAQIVGLSALMTTTLDSMAEITREVKKRNVTVLVGGAVVTQAFADMIGADYYCRDAQEAVKILNKI